MNKIIDFNRLVKEPKIKYIIRVDDRKNSRVDYFQNDIEDNPEQYYTIWIEAGSWDEVESLRLQGLQMLKLRNAMNY